MFRTSVKNYNVFFRFLLIFSSTLVFLAFLILGHKLVLKTILYPLPYKETIFNYSREYGLNNALIYAVIKTESNFKPKAVSEKGAKGLMQITDKTGEYISRMKKIKTYDLFDEQTNIEFGCYYLAYLIKSFDSEELAVIAYNAGEGNVRSWLANPKYSDDNKNLKYIPFPETREYVKKVKKTFEKYKKLYVHILDK